MYLGIICACLPCLRSFFKHYFPNMLRFIDSPENQQRVISLRTFVGSALPKSLKETVAGWGSRRRDRDPKQSDPGSHSDNADTDCEAQRPKPETPSARDV